MSAEPTTCNFDVSKCEFPLHGLGDLTDWTYGFLRVRIFIGGEGLSLAEDDSFSKTDKRGL